MQSRWNFDEVQVSRLWEVWWEELYWDNGKLLVQIFPRSLTEAVLTWFTELDIIKVKKWINLAHVFVDQYKFNSEIAPDWGQLQKMTKKLSESFREYVRGAQTISPV